MSSRSSSPSLVFRRPLGFTLTELMIALVLGALVVLAATAMVVTSRATYRTQDENTRVAESSRFALELVDRMVRLAGYTDFGDQTTPPPNYSSDPSWSNASFLASILPNGPSLVGTDQSYRYGSGAPAINGSDMLTIRFYGSGTPGGPPDGNVLDCAGTPVPAPALSSASYLSNRDFNVLYVDYDTDGEPTLFCGRYVYNQTTGVNTGTDQQALVRGVETFQVLYGEAIYAAGADPDLTAPTQIVYRNGIGGSNPVVNWSNVVSVRIAMLIRSDITGAQADASAVTYNLFGASYPGTSDPGTQFSTASMTQAERTRIRRVVQTTIFVRNRLSPWPALQ